MSASSDSFPVARPTDRVAARLAILAPGGQTEIFFGEPTGVGILDAFAMVAAAAPKDIPGYRLMAVKGHRVFRSLAAVLGDIWCRVPVGETIHDLGERFCKASGIAGVVGNRQCAVAQRGLQEFYYLREDWAERAGGNSHCVGAFLGDMVMSFMRIGHIPVVGATAASAVVLALAILLQAVLPTSVWFVVLAGVCISSTAFCVFLENWARKHYFAEDPREVVLDEVAGMTMAILIAGGGWVAMAFTFLAFRFFDIFKVGVHWVERRKMPGSLVWDDLLAGVYAGFIVIAFRLIVAGYRL
jgi:phosphatidylglycerophosphatase A